MSQINQILTHHQISLIREGIGGKIQNQPVEYAIIEGNNALKIWQIIREHYPQFLPIIIAEELCSPSLISDDLDQINQDIETFNQFDLSQWFEDYWQDYDFENEEDESELANFLPEISQDETNHFTIQYNILNQEFLDNIGIVLFPKIPLYLIPIYLQYGGWNDCPTPDQQAAILKYWSEKYDLAWFGLNNDTVELYLTNPPQNFEDAFNLAKEQMVYCDDLVFQGTMTVKRLGECLVNNNTWSFWWD
jgi:hypothetical protein